MRFRIYNAVLYNAVPYNAVPYNAVQYNAVRTPSMPGAGCGRCWDHDIIPGMILCVFRRIFFTSVAGKGSIERCHVVGQATLHIIIELSLFVQKAYSYHMTEGFVFRAVGDGRWASGEGRTPPGLHSFFYTYIE